MPGARESSGMLSRHDSSGLDRATWSALHLLLSLLGLYWLQNDMGDFVEDGEYVELQELVTYG